MGAPRGNQFAIGNPGPGKKNRPIAQQMISQLNQLEGEVDPKTGRLNSRSQVTRLHNIVKQLLHMALNGDLAAITTVLDRVDGKAPQEMVIAPAGSKEADEILSFRDQVKSASTEELAALYRAALSHSVDSDLDAALQSDKSNKTLN